MGDFTLEQIADLPLDLLIGGVPVAASDGFSAARLEEEVVVTEDGAHVITLFPSADLVVANPY